jgi:hypothetical protein
MKMEQKNIWDGIKFSEDDGESAYELLKNQSEYLIEATSGELKMQIDAIDAYIDGNSPRPAALYMLYIVAPKLGNYRRKILTVAEYSDLGRFPVDIISHLDNSEKLQNISRDEFIRTVEEILSRPIVRNSIQDLYKQSKAFEK